MLLMPYCPLCSYADVIQIYQNEGRGESYFQCSRCEMLFVDPKCHLPAQEEQYRYEQHNNSSENTGYVKFLRTFIDTFIPVMDVLPAKALDYGCGPGPVLAELLKGYGVATVYNYDPFFQADRSCLAHQYPLVTCCEVAEHFCYPRQSWRELVSLVEPGGVLAIRTLQLPESSSFADWWYKNDPTHVCFYNEATFDWIAKFFGLSVTILSDSVVVFKKV